MHGKRHIQSLWRLARTVAEGMMQGTLREGTKPTHLAPHVLCPQKIELTGEFSAR